MATVMQVRMLKPICLRRNEQWHTLEYWNSCYFVHFRVATVCVDTGILSADSHTEDSNRMI